MPSRGGYRSILLKKKDTQYLDIRQPDLAGGSGVRVHRSEEPRAWL